MLNAPKATADLRLMLGMAALVACAAGALPGLAQDGADTTEPEPTEPSFLTYSRIDKAWRHATGRGVKVAILDWLFDLSPEASGKYVSPTSLVPGEPVGSEHPWHGEWMAETVHRIAPEAKIIPIRAKPSPPKDGPRDPLAHQQYLVRGIRFAADQGAVAVTSSMGPTLHGPELTAAIDYAERRGTIFVDVHPEYVVHSEETQEHCAPGDCDARILHPGPVSVPDHPVEPDPRRDVYVWPYQIDPVFRDGWGFSNGPPIVAGVIALMKSANPELSPAEVREIIKRTAYESDGFKVLDAEAAVGEAVSRHE